MVVLMVEMCFLFTLMANEYQSAFDQIEKKDTDQLIS